VGLLFSPHAPRLSSWRCCFLNLEPLSFHSLSKIPAGKIPAIKIIYFNHACLPEKTSPEGPALFFFT